MLLGILALIGGFLIWLLPETKGVKMMDTLEEGVLFHTTFGPQRFCKGKSSGSHATEGSYNPGIDVSYPDRLGKI